MASPIRAVDSWARRVGDAIRVVVTLPDDLSEHVDGGLGRRRVWLRLTRQDDGGRQAFRVPVEVTAGEHPRLVAEVPADQAGLGVWELALRVGRGGPLVALEARLLVTDPGEQPLALLAGPRPETRMPATG